MSIKYICPKCRTELKNPNSMGQQQDTCPVCGCVHTVPLNKKQKKNRFKNWAKEKTAEEGITEKSENLSSENNKTAVSTDFAPESPLINDNNLSMECSCGAVIKIDKRFAGKRGKCPQCGKMIRIPNPWERPSTPSVEQVTSSPDAISNTNVVPSETESSYQPQALSNGLPEKTKVVASSPHDPLPQPTGQSFSAPTLDSSGINTNLMRRLDYKAIIAGSLVLLTFFIPWGFTKDFMDNVNVRMSWNIIGNPIIPGTIVFFMISAWLVGLAAIIVPSLLRGLPVFITKCAIAGIWILILTIWATTSTGTIPGGFGLSLVKTLIILELLTCLLVGLSLIFSHARLLSDKQSDCPLLRIGQGVSCGLVCFMTLITSIIIIVKLSGIHSGGSEDIVGDIIIVFVLKFIILSACILGLIRGIIGKSASGRVQDRVSISLFKGWVEAWCLYALLRPVFAAHSAKALFPSINLILMVVPILYLFYSGGASLLASLLDNRAMVGSEVSSGGGRGVDGSLTPGGIGPAVQSYVTVQQMIKIRLAKVNELYDAGILTADELAAKRADILKDL